MKATLKQHFEELLSEEEQIGDTHFNKIKVADIIFGYNDSKIIEQYKARGKIVTKLELALANQAECDARNRKYYAERKCKTEESKVAIRERWRGGGR